MSDPKSTNLYISNIPITMDDNVGVYRNSLVILIIQDLKEIFSKYNVVSSRILRDTQGNSRGVGFARLVSCKSNHSSNES